MHAHEPETGRPTLKEQGQQQDGQGETQEGQEQCVGPADLIVHEREEFGGQGEPLARRHEGAPLPDGLGKGQGLVAGIEVKTTPARAITGGVVEQPPEEDQREGRQQAQEPRGPATTI